MTYKVHLLNCVQCRYSEVILGPSRQADVFRELHENSMEWRELHEDSIRTSDFKKGLCDKGSVAWAFITDNRAKKSLQSGT